MKITFVVPFVGDVCGGIKAVFEFANQLKKRGHDVIIVYPLIPLLEIKGSFLGTLKSIILNLLKGKKVDWFNLDVNLVRVPLLVDEYMPDADVVVATWWETAYSVSRFSHRKGQKFYLVQHYEIWGGPEDKVNGSYQLGLKIIVNSSWLKNLLKNKLGVETEATILHSPDRDQFYPENTAKDSSIIKILMPYRREKWKGIEDGIKAFEIVKLKNNNVKLVMYGPERGPDIPEHVDFYKRPNNDELRKIYNSCDIFIYPSIHEGFGMPPMEAMACKIPVVVTRVGAVPDYAIAGETALVSEPGDVESFANNIVRLVEDKNERQRIAESGYDYIKQITWETAAEQLEQVFHNNKH